MYSKWKCDNSYKNLVLECKQVVYYYIRLINLEGSNLRRRYLICSTRRILLIAQLFKPDATILHNKKRTSQSNSGHYETKKYKWLNFLLLMSTIWYIVTTFFYVKVKRESYIKIVSKQQHLWRSFWLDNVTNWHGINWQLML